MEVVRHGRVDFTPLLTHRFSLDEIAEAYRVFGEQQDGVIKVAIKPYQRPTQPLLNADSHGVCYVTFCQ